jgi:thiosulfate dehydrogenase [quinone] large subunit
MLFLTVSFHAHPYFTGADIVFVFAWTPFIVAGSGGVLSVDQWLAQRRAGEHGIADVTPVAASFENLANACRHQSAGRCGLKPAKTACGPEACPVLRGQDHVQVAPVSVKGVDRRAVVIASGVAAGSVVLAGAAAGVGRLLNSGGGSNSVALGSSTTTTAAGSTATTTTAASSANGTLIGAASKIPVGSSGSFTLPSGDPGIVIHTATDTWECFDAVCTHMGCTVAYSGGLIACPCHGSTFSATTGDVLGGPAPTALKKYTVKDVNGDLYLQA